MENRITRLEEQVMTLQRERSEDHEDIKFIRQAVANIQQQLASMRLCSAPNTCVQLLPRIEDHERRLTVLEQLRYQAAGGMWVARIVAAIMWSSAGALLTYVLTHKP